ncbi:MAG: hypothetical protein CMF42_02675 [Legionellales bacterium]|nr:hypothetical protein [Legionellales bacterium]OUX67680.1 MAG: hypothetical protein CBD38_01540 [bacterium TMED178]
MDYILHLDQYIFTLLPYLGNWIYLLIALVVFLESACILVPFLPGDGLIFAIGLMVSKDLLNLEYVLVVILSMTIIGYVVNYFLGLYLGKYLEPMIQRWQLDGHLHKAKTYFNQHGINSIIIGRFLPVLRTFLPFVCGLVSMHFWSFLIANISGAFIWTVSFCALGLFIGKIPTFEQYTTLIMMGIMLVSVSPVLYQIIRFYLRKYVW